VSLKEAQRLEKLNLTIPKGAVITGTIVDDVGEPAFGVPVRALKWTWRNGEKTLVAAGNATTDDRGIYRMATLSPGDYIVMATPRADSINPEAMIAEKLAVESFAAGAAGGGLRVAGSPFEVGPSADEPPTSGYAPVFYPGTTLSNTATSVTIGPAEEKTGIDVQLQLVSLGTITGTIVGDQKTILATSVQLADANSGLPGIGVRTASPDATGKFTFTGVAPGAYNLTAKSGGQTTIMTSDGGGNTMMFMTRNISRDGGPGGAAQGPPAPPMWAKADVAVDGKSKSDVALVMQPGMTVAGHVTFDGTGQIPTDLTGIRLILGTAAGNGIISGTAMGTVNADGSFRLTDVMPGKYKISMTPPRGWRASKVESSGKDALDFLLDVQPNDDLSNLTVTFTNKPAELSGTLTDASGMPTAAYTIVLFASDQKYWTPTSRRILTTRPSTDGKFSFRDLPPGDYRLAALEDAEPGSWFDPELLKQLILASTEVTMTEGLRKTQDLRVNK
jgi:hypothetical protein